MLAPFIARLLRKKKSSEIIRRLVNLWPPFRACSISVDRISPDFLELDVSLDLKWRNMNFMGTHAGGPLYEMADPFFVFLISANLGEEYSVWDKSAMIKFLSPGKSKVYAKFRMTQQDLDEIRSQVQCNGRHNFVRVVEIKDGEGTVIAEVDKTIAIKKRPS